MDDTVTGECRLPSLLNFSPPETPISTTTGQEFWNIGKTLRPNKRQLKLTDFGSVEYSPNFSKIAREQIGAGLKSSQATPPRSHVDFISRSASSEPKKQPEDRHKDASQRQIGARVCSKCGFVGDLDDENDRRLHLRVHARFEQGRVAGDEVLNYKGIKYELVLETTETHKVIAVQHGSAPALRKKALGAVKFMEQQLGSVHNSHLRSLGDLVLLSVDLQRKMVDACVCSEDISGKTLEWFENQKLARFPGPQDSHSGADCGIYFMWVAPCSRRKGRATSLLDLLLRHYPRLFPTTLSRLAKNRLALSDPTDDGLLFFRSYFGTQNCQLYRSTHRHTAE